jgi:hypothetical protein
MDYVDVILRTPYYTYQLLVGVFTFTVGLPWPPATQIFGSAVVFILLYPLKLVMGLILPEKAIKRRVYRRRGKLEPTSAEHSAGASAVGSIFH